MTETRLEVSCADMAKARLSEDDVMFTSHDEKSLRSTVVEYYTDDQAKDVYSSSRMKLPTSDQGMSWSKNHFGRLDDAYDTVLTSLKAPGLRRIAIVTVCAALLIWIVWTRILWPWTEEDKIAWNILNSQDSERRIQFETSTRPQLGEIIQIKELDPTLLAGGPRADKSRRLIFIGDIHGCKEELLELLVKVKYDQNKDHIVSVGDMYVPMLRVTMHTDSDRVNKGPDSLGVIDFLMEQGASAVRGNHDDKVIVLAEQHHKAKRDLEARRKKKHGPQGHDAIAHALSRKQLHYLQSFPLILKVGSVKRIGGMVVVHGGLVPGVALEAQDPETVMVSRKFPAPPVSSNVLSDGP